MNRKMWIMFLVIPQLRGALAFLRMKDEDSTGADDEAADALDYALTRLEKWLNEPEQPSVAVPSSREVIHER